MKNNKDSNRIDPKVDYDELWRRTQEEEAKKWEKLRRNWYNWSKEVEERKDKAYSPWLVVPADYNDHGMRPLGGPHWNSPFIRAISPDPSGKPKAGEENFLVVDVFNLGMATSAPTKVDFYWADPSVGLGPADFHHIGTEWVEVLPMSRKTVKCNTPWIPEYLNGGHECIMVNTDNSILDPIQSPFYPYADRHVGQKNMSVLPADAPEFMFWAPFGDQQGEAEIRVMPMIVRATKEFELQQTPFLTLMHRANAALTHLRSSYLNPRLPVPKGLEIRRAKAAQVIRGVEMTKEVRKIRTRRALKEDRGKETRDYMNEGELLLKLEQRPGEAVRLKLGLLAQKLEKNEICILQIAHLVNGVSSNGYTLVLANPAWLNAKAGKDEMYNQLINSDMKNKSMEQLIIERNQETYLTLQIAQQLNAALPLKSFRELEKVLAKGLVVDGQRLPVKMFEPYIPEEIFPLKDTEDMVIKLSAAVRIALGSVQKGTANAVETKAVQAILEGPEGRFRKPIPSGHFTGPSLYGYTLAKKSK